VQLPDFQLEIFFSRWEFAARHNLAASDAQTLTIGELLQHGDREAFEALPLSYAPTWGTPELLVAVAGTYDAVGPEHVSPSGRWSGSRRRAAACASRACRRASRRARSAAAWSRRPA
jgi:hypothetical protein